MAAPDEDGSNLAADVPIMAANRGAITDAAGHPVPLRADELTSLGIGSDIDDRVVMRQARR